MPESMSDAEVDRFLAEKVMKAPVIHEHDPYPYVNGWVSPVIVENSMNGERKLRRPMQDRQRWSPTQDRSDMAEVLEKVTEDYRAEILHRLPYTTSQIDWQWSLLTAPPSIVARAILAAYQEQRTGGPR